MNASDEDYEALDDYDAESIEAMRLSLDDLRAHYAKGELNHLSDDEVGKLLSAAYLRDTQQTILR